MTKQRKKIAIVLGAVILVCVTFLIAYFLFYQKKEDTKITFEDNATIGIMPGVDLEERQKQLQQELDKSMIAFSVNTSPTFATGTSEGNLMLENPGNNAKLLVAEIQLDDTKEIIYKSNYIKPGSYIEYTKLDKPLKEGSYKGTVYFSAYTEDTIEYIGQTGAGITIFVEK